MTHENTKSDVNIAVNELKQDKTDALLRHLQARREDCEERRRAYCRAYRKANRARLTAYQREYRKAGQVAAA